MGNLADLHFDANEVEPNTPGVYTPLPKGEYEAIIVESEVLPNSAGTGRYLKLWFEVIDETGKHDGRKLKAYLNIDNPSSQAREIARGDLSAICRAVGVLDPNDSAELHNRVMGVVVGHEKYQDQMRAKIIGYKQAIAINPSAHVPY